MRNLILILLLVSFSVMAEDAVISLELPVVTMADLKAGDVVRVTNGGGQYNSFTFKEMCFVLRPKGFESVAMLEALTTDNPEVNFSRTELPDGTPVESVKMVTGAICKPDGSRIYLVPKSQLIGLLTQLQNILTIESVDDFESSAKAFSDLIGRREEILLELSEIRRIIVD